MEDDQKNLLALVALLVSTAGFKQELSAIKLGGTSISLLNIFILAIFIFAGLLYAHLLLNGYLSLRRALTEKPKLFLKVIMKVIFFLALIIIPVGTIVLGSLNWVSSVRCQDVSTSNPFGGFPPQSEEPHTQRVCQSRFIQSVLPLSVALFTVGSAAVFIYLNERKYRNMDPALRELLFAIQELRTIQAIRPDIEENIEEKIKDLQREYRRKSRDTRTK